MMLQLIQQNGTLRGENKFELRKYKTVQTLEWNENRWLSFCNSFEHERRLSCVNIDDYKSYKLMFWIFVIVIWKL